MTHDPFTDWKQKHIAIHCVFREKDKEDIKIPDSIYESIKDAWDNANIELKDDKWRIQFYWKRREIREFRFTYPKDNSWIPDEYKIYSAEYKIEKEKRNKFWDEYSPKMTQDQKDSVWSIIMARWWNTYKEAKEWQYGGAWKAYFKWMFKIIALELAWHKDKISSKNWIIANWSKDPETWLSGWEIPEMYDNLPMYREFIK